MSKRWLAALVVVMGVEIALSVFLSAEQLAKFGAGHRDVTSTVASISLGWLAVVFGTVLGVAHSLVSARRALHRGKQALAAVETTSQDWLWETDVDHRLTYCSPGVRDLLGYEPAALLGRSTLTLLTDEPREEAAALMARSVRSGSGWGNVVMTWRRADGTAVALQGNAAPLTDERGQLVGFRGTRRRVTDAEAAQQALAAARQRIDEVLASRSLDIALQPIVDLGTGRLVGAEALARFRDGRGPDGWFREARDTGQSLELDRLAFRLALDTLPRLPADCYLSVNATPELLLSGHLQDDLLGHAPFPLDRLVVEITEHARIHDYTRLQAGLAPLRERGVRLAVDDTGAGYASLTHVLQLRPNIIKIDRSLITDVANDAARRTLVTALVLLAIDVGAVVTGEGIETSSELATLTVLGVDTGQGYLLARPTTDRQLWQEWAPRDWLQAATQDLNSGRGASD